MDSIKNRIGTLIREKRNSRHITQEQLAEKVNLSTGMIGQIERGETMPSIENLYIIIQELDIDPRSLFGTTAPKNADLVELYTIISKMKPPQQQLLLKIAKILREQ